MKPSPAKRYVSIDQYAKIRGASSSVVRYAIEKERISTFLIAGQKMIDVDLANREWEENTDPERSMTGSQSDSAPVSIGNKKYPSFQESRAIKEAYAARITKLDYEEKNRKLVELDKIKEINFDIARRVRDAILNVPGTIAAEVASELDPHTCEKIMHAALSDALQMASKEF